MDYRFATPATPRLHLPEGIVELRHRQPVELRWSAPIEQFAIEVAPHVDARIWIDPDGRDLSYVDLHGAEPGRRYEVRVAEARGTNGAPLVSPARLAVETAAVPSPIPALTRFENGSQITLPWDHPLESFDHEITPAVESVVAVDPLDRRLSQVVLQNPRQGQQYVVTIKGAVGLSGAPVTNPHSITVVTPPPVEIVEVSPTDGAYRVGLQEPISIAFSEPVRDRAAAEAAITFAPALQGRFEWPEPDRVQFVPEGRLPGLTEIAVQVGSGPEGVRGLGGGYLEDSFRFSFLTRPDKLIEVDLTRQQLALYDGEVPVFTAPVSTGVRGAETPTGEFAVEYELPATRMRGVNPDGSRYDIPNVPWVLPFLGDYTLHGAPWRARFGFPQSNGCVSMETGVAKLVYEWAPEGTQVRIHY